MVGNDELVITHTKFRELKFLSYDLAVQLLRTLAFL